LKSAKTETAVSQRETIRQLIDLVDILRNRYTEKPTLDLIQVNGRSAW